MDSVLVKILAVAMTFSQVATAPDTKTHFDPIGDQQQVVALLRSGCQQMRRAFNVEDLDIDGLIATAMDDPAAMSGGPAVMLRGIDIAKLHTAYRQFCKNEKVAASPVEISDVIAFYNRTMLNLPDHARLKDLKLPGASVVLDRNGRPFAEVYERDQRRVWVPLAEIPLHVQQAFIAAEDKRFYEHKGIDERALVRAFIGNLTQPGRPQGGSTITQQVVKNLLVGEELTYERKMREMLLAFRVERVLAKSEILELYLNSIYLGRASGVEMAARSYFGKSAQELSVAEGALLAGLTKGPGYFNPDRHPARAEERFRYVLGRMQDDGAITADEARRSAFPALVADDRVGRLSGSYFADQVARELRTTSGLSAFRVGSYAVRSTLHPELQQAAERALQDGLARYEANTGRVDFQGPELNLAQAIGRIEAETDPNAPAADKSAWQQALENARLPMHDVQWPIAVVIERAATRKGDGSIKVGLADGRILPLQGRGAILRTLKRHDVVLVSVSEGKGSTARAELRVRPVVQGAAVVLENKTGRILAMTGGFSYALSQLNRATQSQRQPGSALKPLTYLAALQKGLQPNTLVRDADITLPPIDGSKREQDYWSPKNYDGGSSGAIPLRAALENSRNLATVNLLDGGIDTKAPASLDRICELAVDLQVYKECARYYPFVLGAQPVRPIDLAIFYATVANEGMRPTPYAIEAIEREGDVVYRHSPTLVAASSADRVSFYQLKAILQGVVQRGTARRIGHLASAVAGKTGTTDDENDAWFVGFSNDVTVGVWVGYDNADGRRRTLGSGQTGARVAVPIFEPIMQAVFAYHAPQTRLAPPSPEARRLLATAKADRTSGEDSRGGGLVEYFRRDAKGRALDTRYALVSRRDNGMSKTTTRKTASKTAARHQPSEQPRADAPPRPDRAWARGTGGGSWGGWGNWGNWGGGGWDGWAWQGRNVSRGSDSARRPSPSGRQDGRPNYYNYPYNRH